MNKVQREASLNYYKEANEQTRSAAKMAGVLSSDNWLTAEANAWLEGRLTQEKLVELGNKPNANAQTKQAGYGAAANIRREDGTAHNYFPG